MILPTPALAARLPAPRRYDVAVIGASLGGCAAALAAARCGRRVLLVEDAGCWIGGQLTSQAVPPDEHPWIESYGRTASYARLRQGLRAYYRAHYPLAAAAMADPLLNPGQGWVSALCCEPRVALATLEQMLAPHVTAGRLELRVGRRPVGVSLDATGERIASAEVEVTASGARETIEAAYFLDATELGDLLPLAGAEYRTGAERRARFGEWHAPDAPADRPGSVQALTWCLAAGYDPAPGASHVIERPAQYERWRGYVPDLAPTPWPGPLLGLDYTDPFTLAPRRLWIQPPGSGDNDAGPPLFTYRRIVSQAQHQPGAVPHDVTLVNWPQNDYLAASVIDQDAATVARSLGEARQLSLSLLYWLQTEAPRPGGGAGYPGLYPAPSITGAPDGLAQAPYIRESRRIESVFTVTEAHVGAEMLRAEGRDQAAPLFDSVGCGHYRIDLHPTTGGDNYIDIASRSFQIPLGALLPVRLRNLLPACKNLGVTHITNGCYRLHPVEWNIGESAGALAAFCVERGCPPHAVREDAARLSEFQARLVELGVELAWPSWHRG